MSYHSTLTRTRVFAASLVIILAAGASAESILTGRLVSNRYDDSPDEIAMSAVFAYANVTGSVAEPRGFRTFETYPSGWYYMPGPVGNHTLLFTAPAGFVRPKILSNLFTDEGEIIDRNVTPDFAYYNFFEGGWDEKPASDYYQTFIASGTSVTHVGFKPVTDGVDGQGPLGQHMLLSVHRVEGDEPGKWPQVGPTVRVPDVDCGGVKGYSYSAGWNSGEVPIEPGSKYAVRLTAEAEGGTFQTFWREDNDPKTDCYRIGPDGNNGWQKREMWMAIATDNNGLVIPYNKRVHKQFGEFAGGAKTWSQTYVARGKGLAGVVLYAAMSGTQPGITRQRARVVVREGGPGGPPVGISKIAIGNGQYTGDASWGTFGAVYAPGEVKLEPGRTYAIEFTTIENWESLHGFENIKGMPSDMKPGFNPYRKMDPDDYPLGDAYAHGKDKQDFDLDMQIIEYQESLPRWQRAVTGENLVVNGNAEFGKPTEEGTEVETIRGWKTFKIDPGTVLQNPVDGEHKDNRVFRVIGGGVTGKTVNGGFVQKVGNLKKVETYRVVARVRCTWPIDDKHAYYVGYDATGQDANPEADTIVWDTLPSLHGIWHDYVSEPIRPADNSISIWLRGKTTQSDGFPYRADFDNVRLRQVNVEIPAGSSMKVMSFNIRYGTASDGPDLWSARRDVLFETIRRHMPDVLGVQEALRWQLDEIAQAVPGYEELGVGRDDGREGGEYSAILFRLDRLAVDNSGTFWISETPHAPGSQSWGSACPRVCTHARFIDRHTGRHFRVYNTHLDHVSGPARERGVEMIAQRIAKLPKGEPVIVTGDLNCGEESRPIRYLKGHASHVTGLEAGAAPSPALADSFRIAHPDVIDVGTFGNYRPGARGEKIDYVLVSQDIAVLDAEIVQYNQDGRFPSDHYPVTAELLLM